MDTDIQRNDDIDDDNRRVWNIFKYSDILSPTIMVNYLCDRSKESKNTHTRLLLGCLFLQCSVLIDLRQKHHWSYI